MSLLSTFFGSHSEVELENLNKEFQLLLTEKETPIQAHKLVRDYIVLTDKRIILVDKQGMTGKKTVYHSIPYHSIIQFYLETAGHFEICNSIKLHIRGQSELLSIEFVRNNSIYDCYKIISYYTCQ